jgi:hypothetical protein
MASANYTAKRSIAAGHQVNLGYSIELPLMSTNPGVRRTRRVETTKSLDGNVETLYYGRDLMIEIMLAPFRWSEHPYLREFLDSTEDGQVFSFDLYGTVATPKQPIQVVRDDDGYNEERWLALGQDGSEDYFTLSIKVRTT